MIFQLHLIVLLAVTAALFAASLVSHRWFRASWAKRAGKRNPNYSYVNNTKDDLPSFWIRGVAVALAAIMALVFIISLLPYSPRYWVLTQKTGTIETLSNRFVEGNGDLSGQTYTLTLKGDPTPHVVTDSRVLGLSTGDFVDLTCSLEWVYGGADTSNCYLRSFAN